jgi:endonuclease III
MQTRAAAKRLAEAALAAQAVGCDEHTVIADTEAAVLQAPTVTQTPEPVDNLESASKVTTGGAKHKGAEKKKAQPADNSESVNQTTGGTKRKRGGKKQVQPRKGGWVLPHGMGARAVEANPSAPQDAEVTSAATAVDGLPGGTESPAQEHLEAGSQADTEKKGPRPTRQTRLSLRITKVETKNQTSTEKEHEPTVKLEDTDGPAIEEEDGAARKRPRTVRLADGWASDVTSSDKKAQELAEVKVEEKKILGQRLPKFVIIKGITIKDNVVIKTASNIVIDASQILDPNFRRMVKRGATNPYALTPGYSPYPYRRVPTPEACEEVHDILTEMHGEVKQPEEMPVASIDVAGCGEVPCVLDALLRTLISGNTLMAMADLAVKRLAEHYGLGQEGTGAGSINWDKVRLSSHNELANVIRVSGNGPKKSQHIKQILDRVYEENGTAQSPATRRLSLDHMHGMTKDEALAKFVSYPGIGIKTAACVTLFCLRKPCFAVDTHVHKFCRWLGWVPDKADPDNCFRHGDFMVPDHLKYGLHQLFIRHGQDCFKCRKATKPGTKDWNEAADCPLEHLLVRSKDEAASKPPKRAKEVKKEKEDNVEEEESSGLSDAVSVSDVEADEEEEDEEDEE